MLDKDLQKIALLIDSASDAGNLVEIHSALKKLEELKAKSPSSISLAKIHFYSANCYASIRGISEKEQPWLSWDNAELEKEIYSLRCASKTIQSVDITDDLSDLRFRISTNLANALNQVGRFVEAISLWDEVLKVHPEYSMSVANRGHAFFWYARYLYDSGHQELFLNESYNQIKTALSLGVEQHAENDLKHWLSSLSEMNDWESFQFQPPDEPLGKSEEERKYRKWALKNRLFLNPLNDLWIKDIVANDVLTFPSIIVSTKDRINGHPPEVYAIYNQLKQEFVSARYMLFEAIQDSKKDTHFSDSRVKLYNMLDYRNYCLWIEKTKMVFLTAHAIFDKIGYLVNDYWKLSLPARNISFRRCWFMPRGRQSELAPAFQSSTNWALRGLFWLSKDFAGEKGESEPLQPDAWHIAEIRNHIAHKYLKVFDHVLVDTEELRSSKGHEFQYPISDRELIYQTSKLLGLVRSALIYVALAASHEEKIKKENLGSGMLGEIGLIEIDDKYRF